MKADIFKYMAAAGLALAALTGCQDHFDDMKMETPVATLEANTTIAEFKAAFWDEANNYCNEVPAKEDGSHYIVKGRVISSDYDGNIFKCLYIQDETGALPLSINQYNLYMTNRRGQEIVLDLTGMYAGKYNGMFQMGFPEWYDRDQTYETSFMAPELFNAHREYNGNPEPAEIDTILVSDFSQLSSDAAGLQKWQGQLVRFNNATFANAGQPGEKLCAEYHSSGYNQSLNVNGGAINVRTSGYAKFWNTPLPSKPCDVVGILSYYGTQGWQLLLNDVNGLMNIGDATTKGTQSKPYTVDEAIALSDAGSTSAWVEGYIVGTPAIDVMEITSNADIQWDAPYVVDSYVVIAPSPETRDYTKCMVVPIASDSQLYQYGNLADNANVAGRRLNIQGRFTRQMGIAAVTGNPGTPSTFEIEGIEIEDPNKPIASGNGTEESPYNPTQIVGMNNPGNLAWVSGYIVGVYNYNNNSAFEPGVPTTVNSCIAISTTPDAAEGTVIPVQLPFGEVREALNLVNNPGNLNRVVTVQGTLEKFYGKPGVKNVAAYKLAGGPDTPEIPADGGTKEKPYTVAEAIALGSTDAPAWVEGYIVGTSTGGATFAPSFTTDGAVASNLLLAASADETDPSKLFPVQLSSTSPERAKLNLKDNPSNFHKKVKIEGTLKAYFNMPGMRDVTASEIE